jgi:hypothetical protein
MSHVPVDAGLLFCFEVEAESAGAAEAVAVDMAQISFGRLQRATAVPGATI